MNVLSNGIEIPEIGFGTWKIPNGEEAINSVQLAIDAGYRHIDTAAAYGNEESVGIAIKNKGVRREDIFVTSKVFNDDQGYDKTLKAFENSLKRLDMEYLDLYLIHWPIPRGFFGDFKKLNIETWRAMERLYEEGLIKAIGLSNFKEIHLTPILCNANICPMVNQIEIHPGFNQEETVRFSKKNNIVVEGWSPLGSGALLNNKELKEIAKGYNKSVAQLSIKWSIQRGIIPIPRSTNKERIKENINVYDFTISDEDMDKINNINIKEWSGLDPDNLRY